MRSEGYTKVVRVRPFVCLLVGISLTVVGFVCLLSHISPVRPEKRCHVFSGNKGQKKVWGFASNDCVQELCRVT